MKVTFIITNLATGGAESMLLKLLQHINRSRFEPVVVSLVGMGEIGPHIAALGIPVHTIGMRQGAIPNPLQFFRLVRLLRHLKPDMVHTWMYHADLLGGLAARLAGCQRVIWGIHHNNLSTNANKRSTLRVVKLCAWLSSWLPSAITSCAVTSKEVHAKAGYPANKIFCIPNGFDISKFHPSSLSYNHVRENLGISCSTPLVGLFARFDSQKNHCGFVQAAAQVLKQLPHVHFVLAGKDIDNSNPVLQQAIIEHPCLDNHVHLLGLRNDIPELMAALDAYVSSSSGEAFPIVLGEAMACGAPCVVTDVGDSAEIVGDTGRVVPAGDMMGLARELVALLQLPTEERSALGARARARIEKKYEISRVARMYESLYEMVLKDSHKVQN